MRANTGTAIGSVTSGCGFERHNTCRHREAEHVTGTTVIIDIRHRRTHAAQHHKGQCRSKAAPKLQRASIDAHQPLPNPAIRESSTSLPASAHMPGGLMDFATQTHLTMLRNLLTYRQAELRAEVHAAQMAREETQAAVTPEVSDQKDGALQQQLEGIDSAQEQRDIDELAQVELALKRLDAGTYGTCLDCNEPIPLERLRVQPAAQRCAVCQLGQERTLARSR
jgi:DnaK suppressor protein